MPRPILPFAQPLILCDECRPSSGGKIDFLGAFQTIRPESYPYVLKQFSVVAQVSGGLGTMTTYVDVRHAETGELAICSLPRELHIPNREILVRIANSFINATFKEPGTYLVELFFEHACIADTRILFLERPAIANGEYP